MRGILFLGALALVFGVAIAEGGGARAMFKRAVGEDKDDYGNLLHALPASKHTLAAGIKQAGAHAPEAVISAKFELEEGKLSLSVYTVEKGLATDAEHNVLKELAGAPTGDSWKPEAEVFKDVPHVARASQQLTLMALTKLSLLDILAKAEKDQPGVAFSITPALHDQKPAFVVLVAFDGKAVELRYDLMTGERIQR